jgi:Ca2+-binding RTX toxin-like protein
MRRLARLAAALSIGLSSFVASGPASAQEVDPIVTTTDALALARAMVQDEGRIEDASFEVLSSEHANAVSSAPLTSFPVDGSTYAIMTSGDARLADGDPALPGHPMIWATVANPSTEPSSDQVRGNTDFDVSILRLDLDVPAGLNCLSLDFRFLSEEFPDFIGDTFNDAFIAELGESNWGIDSATQEILAPNNFAFDQQGNVVSINSTGIGGMTPQNAAGTAYEAGDPQLGQNNDGGATQLLRASTPITEGQHQLHLSILDQGDQAYDSAVFIDNLLIGTAGPGGCEAGVEPAPCFPPTVEGTEAGNKLTGSGGADEVQALGGRDYVDALAGADEVCGGDGGDYLYGRGGRDSLLGEGGNDRLYGGDQADELEGGPGHDAFIPGNGPDVILAQDGTVDCIQRREGDHIQRDPEDILRRHGCSPGFWLQ